MLSASREGHACWHGPTPRNPDVYAAFCTPPLLQTFCFEAEKLEMEAGCLPPSLRTLCLTWDSAEGQLPPAITRATHLRSLSLRDFSGDVRAIERLRQLTYLRLGARCPYGQVPKALRLSAFPELQGLVLTTHDSPYPLTLKAASPLLQQLTYLELGGVTPESQRRFCAGLGALTGLQVSAAFALPLCAAFPVPCSASQV